MNDKEQEINIDLSNNDLLQIFDIPSLNSILINTYNYDSQKYELSLINKVSKREEILFQSKRNIVSINDLSEDERYVVFTENTYKDKVNIRIINLTQKRIYTDLSEAISIKKMRFSTDNSSIYILTDEFTNFHSIYSIDIDQIKNEKYIREYKKVFISKEKELDDFEISEGDYITFLKNNNGISELYTLYKKTIEKVNIGKIGVITELISNKSYTVFKISNLNLPMDIGIANSEMKVKYLNINEENKNIEISHLNYKLGSNGPFINVYNKMNSDFKQKPPFIFIHGGPHSQDRPGYDQITKVLVKMGYVVISLNYHGSTGYGKKYRKSSYGRWGEVELKDISLVYDWVKRNKFNHKKIMIGGISYGAYLTLLEISKGHNIYYKAVAISGPVDLYSFLINMPEYTKKILYERVGNPCDKASLTRRSPITYVQNIQTPLFIAFGSQDKKIDVKSVKKFINLCQKYRKEIKYLALEEEGHNFKNQNNIKTLFQEVIHFLN